MQVRENQANMDASPQPKSFVQVNLYTYLMHIVLYCQCAVFLTLTVLSCLM